MADIGNRIMKRRMELGMSQEDLAKKVGYKDRSSIAKIESGERDIRQNKVILFANALHTTPQWLMGYEETKNAPAESESAEMRGLFEQRTRHEWENVIDGLSRENKIRLIEYAKLLLLSQGRADQEDSK